MSFELYTAIRLSRKKKSHNGLSLTLLTIIGVALSISIMLLSISIIKGFKKEIYCYVYSQTGHISIYSQGSNWLNTDSYIDIDNKALTFFKSDNDIKTIIPVVQSTGIIKTNNDFDGIFICGFPSSNIPLYYHERIHAGKIDLNKDSINNRPAIILPQTEASKLKLSVNDKVVIYFHNGNTMVVRAFTVVGTYNSAGMVSTPAICNINYLQKVNHINNDTYSRLMIFFKDENNINSKTSDFSSLVKDQGAYYIGDNVYGMNTAMELIPTLSNWLDILDTNVYFILIIMVLICGFTMITGLIVIVLDKSIHISILKSLGSSNKSIRNIFVLLAAKIAFIGFSIGNIISATICFIQDKYHIVKLDPKFYYMDHVPIYFSFTDWLLIDILGFIIVILFVLYPSYIVRKIYPYQSLTIEN